MFHSVPSQHVPAQRSKLVCKVANLGYTFQNNPNEGSSLGFGANNRPGYSQASRDVAGHSSLQDQRQQLLATIDIRRELNEARAGCLKAQIRAARAEVEINSLRSQLQLERKQYHTQLYQAYELLSQFAAELGDDHEDLADLQHLLHLDVPQATVADVKSDGSQSTSALMEDIQQLQYLQQQQQQLQQQQQQQQQQQTVYSTTDDEFAGWDDFYSDGNSNTPAAAATEAEPQYISEASTPAPAVDEVVIREEPQLELESTRGYLQHSEGRSFNWEYSSSDSYDSTSEDEYHGYGGDEQEQQEEEQQQQQVQQYKYQGKSSWSNNSTGSNGSGWGLDRQQGVEVVVDSEDSALGFGGWSGGKRVVGKEEVAVKEEVHVSKNKFTRRATNRTPSGGVLGF